MRRRDLVVGAGALLAASPAPIRAWAQPPQLVLSGKQVQGGFVFGRTAPRAQISLDGEAITAASAGGYFVVGFDRDAPATARLRIANDHGAVEHSLDIASGTFDIQRVNGLPDSQVNPSNPALLARIKAEGARKAAGFASRIDSDDFRLGFTAPLASYRVSGRFGGQRILNGEPRRPHYGADLAAPKGMAILAPARGLVSFAEPGLHFEGGLVLIDHGQGLVSAYLHQSRLDVTRGQTVVRGQPIGAVGMEGRATGPHLCWRLTWRGRHLDPTLLMGVRAPGAA